MKQRNTAEHNANTIHYGKKTQSPLQYDYYNTQTETGGDTDTDTKRHTNLERQHSDVQTANKASDNKKMHTLFIEPQVPGVHLESELQESYIEKQSAYELILFQHP